MTLPVVEIKSRHLYFLLHIEIPYRNAIKKYKNDAVI